VAGVAYFRVPYCPDGESDRLRAVLADHLKCEQLTARRRLLTSLLALLSAPVWLMAVWPRLLEGPDRRFMLYLFGFLLAISLGAVIEEWRATRRLRQWLEEGSPDINSQAATAASAVPAGATTGSSPAPAEPSP